MSTEKLGQDQMFLSDYIGNSDRESGIVKITTNYFGTYYIPSDKYTTAVYVCPYNIKIK